MSKTMGLAWVRRDKTWPGKYQLLARGPLDFVGMDGMEGVYVNDDAIFRLMDSAPGLLEALKYIVTASSLAHVKDIARAAIAKAEGTSAGAEGGAA